MPESMIDRLAAYVSEPYRKEEVLAAARKLQPPFLMREVANATGLHKSVVHRVLSRCVKQGILTRQKAMMSTTGLLGGGSHAWLHGTVVKPQWLYSWVEPR